VVRAARLRKRSAALACVAAVGLFTTCQTLGLSRSPLTASLRTDSTQITVHHSGFGYHADIGFVYTNTTSKPVAKTGCGFPPWPDLEKKVNDKWVVAYNPAYLACLTKPDFTLQSGKRFHGVLPFAAFEPGHNIMPTLDVPSIDGVYRLRWDFVEGTDASMRGARRVKSTSNEFRMVLAGQ
jgi:hypothetical protein